jgi:glycosyltransferase involved in cell wall biosynthesis
MTPRLRIALVSTVATPVRRVGSASVESVVWLLARELTALGHAVTVFGTAGSEVDGELVATVPGPYGRAGAPEDWNLSEWINLSRALQESGRFDVLHAHAYLWGIPLEPLARAPMVHTLHVMPGPDQAMLLRNHPNACVTALSHAQWALFPDVAPLVVSSAVDESAFTFQPAPGDYALFLGRFIPQKGPLRAIAAARTLGLPLRMAAPMSSYYREAIEPHVDGRTVIYEGEVGGAERNALLGGARVLLYPLVWPEPFGLVQVEAMRCGTPVAAMAIGASPEIIEEGVTGSCATDEVAFEDAVTRCLALDRRVVHDRAVARFSARQMALDYVRVYEECLAGTPRRGSGSS